MTLKQKITALCCICLLLGTFMGYWINEDSTVRMDEQQGTATGRDALYTIVIDTEKRPFVDGKAVEVKLFQKLLGVGQDGKIGPETIGMMMEFNRLDEIK